MHSKLTSIIRHRSRCEVTLNKSPHSTSCPQRSPLSGKKGRFFILMHTVYFRNFHCGEAWCSHEALFYILPSWVIKSQDHCQDQFPLLIAFNELLENISCVSFQGQPRWTFSSLFFIRIDEKWFSYSWIFLSLVSAPDPPTADFSGAVLVFNWYSRGWADWIQSLKLSSKFLV